MGCHMSTHRQEASREEDPITVIPYGRLGLPGPAGTRMVSE